MNNIDQQKNQFDLKTVFPVIQAMVRCAIGMLPEGTNVTNAFSHQVERFRKLLEGAGFNEEAKSLMEVLSPAEELKGMTIVQSKHPDYTFWTRFLDFIGNVQVNDAMSEEEKEYLIYTGEQQLKQQFENSKGEERTYLKTIHKQFQ